MLDIRLLGPVGAERGGEPVALGGPRQRAVLARLALVAGQVVTVDRLIDDVWAGEPPATAVNTLQSYVSLLRRALGGAERLLREGPGYALAVDRSELDTARFEDRLASAREQLASDPRRALDELDAALAEWRGPVLADVADEEWARAAAVRWDDMRLAALEARFDALLALGRNTEAIGELERAIDEHPFREGFTERVMIALYRSGRQTEALRAFGRTREVLADELGLDPSPRLAALQTSILNHDPSLAAPGLPAARNGATAPPQSPSSSSRSSLTPAPEPSPVPLPAPVVRATAQSFVGREKEIAAIRQMWEETLEGQRRIALVTGEPGVGKSSLAAHVAASMHADGAIVLWGRATSDAVVPFEPMVQALRTVLRVVSTEARQRVVTERGTLATLIPELQQLVPEVEVTRPDPSVERYLLFETIADLLHTESTRYPLLVVLDDMHWADAVSLQLIEHVMRHELSGRVMLIGTARSTSDDANADLDQMAAGLAREGMLRRVPLVGLDAADVVELLRAFGRDETDAGELHAATGGNAFFISELIAHTDDRSDGELPRSVVDMVGARLDGLDRPVANVVAVAAVAEPMATLPVLANAAALDTNALLDAADAAVANGLLRDDGAGRLSLPHSLIRQAVLTRLSRTRRLDLHRRVADALETSSGPEVSRAEIAHHLLEGGSLVERSRQLDAVLAAGHDALAVLAYEDAAEWSTRAEELCDARTSPIYLAELHLLRCEAARALGDRDGAIEAARRATAAARSSDDPMLLARSAESWMRSVSAVGFDFGEPADAELVLALEDAIAVLPEHERAYHVRLRSMLASVLVEPQYRERQHEVARQALAIATADGQPALMASAQLARRLALWKRDMLDERTAAVIEAVDQARRVGNVHLELTAMLFAMTDLMEQGDLKEYFAMLEAFQRRAAQLHQPLYDVYAMFLHSCRAVVVGDYDAAQRIADQALAAGLGSHGRNAEVAYAGQLFQLAWDRGQLAELVPLVEDYAAGARGLPVWQVALAGCYVEAGMFDEARVIFERFVEPDRVDIPDDPMFFTAAGFMVETARWMDDPVRARLLFEILEPYGARIAVTGLGGVCIGPVSRYVGVAAHASGQADEAVRWLARAVADAERLGSPPFEARARRDLAAAHRARAEPGDFDRAAAESDAAAAIAGRLGMVLLDVP
jgi:DNA-binding SARP family transcriptional activator